MKLIVNGELEVSAFKLSVHQVGKLGN